MRHTSLVWILILTMLVLPVSGAVSSPIGMDGYVYALDGTTPVPNLVEITITNLDEPEKTFLTSPGRGKRGRYSVALPWPKNTEVEITATNPEHSISRQVTLAGILHGVDLYLNMSISPLPPNITSVPSGNATQGSPYTYTPKVFDWNNDPLVHSLSDSPIGMNMDEDTGIISWVPTPEETGTQQVTYSVSDGTHTVEQSFQIYVRDVNDPPSIENATIVSKDKETTHQLEAEDIDGDLLTFALVSDHSNVIVSNSGMFTYTRKSPPISEDVVVVSVSDGEFTTEGYVKVVRKEERSSGGGRSRQTKDVEENANSLGEEVIEHHTSAPEGTVPLDRLTYGYFTVPEDETDASFIVETSWLERHGLDLEDVKVYTFTNKWEEVPTQRDLLTGNLVLSTKIGSETLFAVGANRDVEPQSIKETVINEPSVIVIFVFDEKGNPVPEGEQFKIENKRTKESFVIKTGTGPARNVIQAVLQNAMGDVISLTSVNSRLSGSVEFVAGDINTFNVTLKSRWGIGEVTKSLNEGNLKGEFGVFLILLVIVSSLLYLRYRFEKVVNK